MDTIDPDLAAKLPPLAPADRSIGALGASVARRFGLSPACRVDAGSGDNMYAAVGTGNIEPGLFTVSLGTSGTACTVLERPFVDPTGEIASYCDSTGRYLPLLCVSNLANGYNALRAAKRRTYHEERAADHTSGMADPVQEAEHSEERDRVRAALNRMPERQAQLLILRYSGLSYNELAAAVGCSPNSVGTLLARAEETFERLFEG